MKYSLEDLGWNAKWQEKLDSQKLEDLSIGRVTAEFKSMFRLLCPTKTLLAKPSGRLLHLSKRREEMPAVGDWVLFRQGGHGSLGLIDYILPRKSKFSRKEAGRITEEQIIAANIDVVFLVMGLDKDFNVRRLERYLVTAWNSGAKPIVVLSKADLCKHVERSYKEASTVSIGIPIIVTSSLTGVGLQDLNGKIAKGVTGAFLGSSGAGKSTLINALIGEERQAVQEVRAHDQRGRHTTTYRELFLVPSGGILIDTPGMRELQLWESQGGLETTFQDIESLAAQCHFNDCSHETEPNCAVKEAIERGELALIRLQNYGKLQAELAYLKRKEDVRAMQANKGFWKQVSKNSNSKHRL